MTEDGAEAPKAGYIVFTDRHEPPLQAGNYLLTVSQTVTLPAANKQQSNGEAAPDGQPHVEVAGRSYRVGVRGERLALDAGELLSVYPPAGSEGFYGSTFPHVVFARATLPWERSPQLGKDGGSGASWLALLTFDSDTAPAVQSTTLGALIDADLGTIASYASAFQETGEKFGIEVGESKDDTCQVIELGAEDFGVRAPTLADLELLAHVRTVSTARKAGAAEDTSAHAILVCGALARRWDAADGPVTVHLVSLEGLGRYLPDAAGAPPDALKGRRVRLVTLANWVFRTHLLPRDFKSYMQVLDVAPLGRAAPASGDDAAAAVNQALALGYTAVPHTLRTNTRTMSWLRGPLLPCGAAVPALLDDLPQYKTADSALGFDPATQMLDASYAAAWQVGRVLMLCARDTAVSLAAYKQSATHAALAAALAATGPSSGQRPVALALAVAGLNRAASVAASGPPEPLRNAVALAARLLSPAQAGAPVRTSASRGSRVAVRTQAWAIQSRATADTATLQAAVQAVPRPPGVVQWLANLALLRGLPLAYLVPDPDMLPPESIRFFRLDLGWISALLEGACSMGRGSSKVQTIDCDAEAAARLRADALLQAGLSETGASGFLLRSAALDVWPRMEFEGFRDGIETQVPPQDVLRHELLAPGMLLFLARGLITHVRLHEPAEGLHFGIDHDGCKTGRHRDGSPGAKVSVQTSRGAVVDIVKLGGDLNVGGHAGDFAYQLVETVQSFTFVAGNT